MICGERSTSWSRCTTKGPLFFHFPCLEILKGKKERITAIGKRTIASRSYQNKRYLVCPLIPRCRQLVSGSASQPSELQFSLAMLHIFLTHSLKRWCALGWNECLPRPQCEPYEAAIKCSMSHCAKSFLKVPISHKYGETKNTIQTESGIIIFLPLRLILHSVLFTFYYGSGVVVQNPFWHT